MRAPGFVAVPIASAPPASSNRAIWRFLCIAIRQFGVQGFTLHLNVARLCSDGVILVKQFLFRCFAKSLWRLLWLLPGISFCCQVLVISEIRYDHAMCVGGTSKRSSNLIGVLDGVYALHQRAVIVFATLYLACAHLLDFVGCAEVFRNTMG